MEGEGVNGGWTRVRGGVHSRRKMEVVPFSLSRRTEDTKKGKIPFFLFHRCSAVWTHRWLWDSFRRKDNCHDSLAGLVVLDRKAQPYKRNLDVSGGRRWFRNLQSPR